MPVPLNFSDGMTDGLAWARQRAVDALQAEEMRKQNAFKAWALGQGDQKMAETARHNASVEETNSFWRQGEVDRAKREEDRRIAADKAATQEKDYQARVAPFAVYDKTPDIGAATNPIMQPVRENARAMAQGQNPWQDTGIPMDPQGDAKYNYKPEDLWKMQSGTAMDQANEIQTDLSKRDYDRKLELAKAGADTKIRVAEIGAEGRKSAAEVAAEAREKRIEQGNVRIQRQDENEVRRQLDPNGAARNTFGTLAGRASRMRMIIPLLESGQGITPEQFNEIPQAIAAAIGSGNTATLQAIKDITPPSYKLNLARWKEFVTGNPSHPDVVQFVKLYANLIDRELGAVADQYHDIYAQRLPSLWGAFNRSPEAMTKVVQGYGITPDKWNLDPNDLEKFGTYIGPPRKDTTTAPAAAPGTTWKKL
jgi:hypothetical protein